MEAGKSKYRIINTEGIYSAYDGKIARVAKIRRRLAERSNPRAKNGMDKATSPYEGASPLSPQEKN